MAAAGKIKVSEAARILNMTEQFVRIAMQQDRLKIGTAVKTSSIWTYCINEKQLAEYSGKDIKKELAKIRKTEETAVK